MVWKQIFYIDAFTFQNLNQSILFCALRKEMRIKIAWPKPAMCIHQDLAVRVADRGSRFTVTASQSMLFNLLRGMLAFRWDLFAGWRHNFFH
jgi:hypothetical protein